MRQFQPENRGVVPDHECISNGRPETGTSAKNQGDYRQIDSASSPWLGLQLPLLNNAPGGPSQERPALLNPFDQFETASFEGTPRPHFDLSALSEAPAGHPASEQTAWEWPAVDEVEPIQQKQVAWRPEDGLLTGSGTGIASGLVPEILSKANVFPGLELARICFPTECDQEQIEREYLNFVAGRRQYFEPMLGHSITVHADFIYKLGDRAVGMGGAYQYPEEPDRVWLSWFGVDPDHRRHGFGAEVLKHIEGFARELGIPRLAAYTEDDQINRRCHRFYEALGYQVVDRFMVGDELMRVYEKRLDLPAQPEETETAPRITVQ